MTKAEKAQETTKAATAKADAKSVASLPAIADELDAIASNPTIDPGQLRAIAAQLREFAEG